MSAYRSPSGTGSGPSIGSGPSTGSAPNAGGEPSAGSAPNAGISPGAGSAAAAGGAPAPAPGADSPPSVYLRLRKRIGIRPEGTVTLKHAARLFANDPELEARLESLVLHRHSLKDGNRVVIDLLQIVRLIREEAPGAVVDAYGDPQVLVIVADAPREPRKPLLIITWLLLFFGSGLAIMNFHTDVNMKDVHERITQLVTGRKTEHPLWFQIPYSIGIGVGMLVFFNHLFRKRFNEEPNPLEVELYMYEENVNAYVIAEEMRKKKEPDEESDPGQRGRPEAGNGDG